MSLQFNPLSFSLRYEKDGKESVWSIAGLEIWGCSGMWGIECCLLDILNVENLNGIRRIIVDLVWNSRKSKNENTS